MSFNKIMTIVYSFLLFASFSEWLFTSQNQFYLFLVIICSIFAIGFGILSEIELLKEVIKNVWNTEKGHKRA